jgi:hypothetical protein
MLAASSSVHDPKRKYSDLSLDHLVGASQQRRRPTFAQIIPI